MLKKKKTYHLAILGATGVAGAETLKVLEKRNFPVESIKCFASESSVGKTLTFQGKTITVEKANEKSFDGMDIAFFAADSASARKFAPIAKKAGCIVIDKSSAFRMDPLVPLVIPELNPEDALKHQGLLACPNCTACILLMPLFPLHKAFRLKRIVAATYQAASGGGKQMLQKLIDDMGEALKNPDATPTDSYSYGFNLFPHNTPFSPNGYVEEEVKVIEESHKILGDPKIAITATCVRVPVIRSHSIAVNAEFHKGFTVEEAYGQLRKASGVQIIDDRVNNRFATPIYASKKDEVFCGRLRLDAFQPNTLELWIVGDQLLKGAALNAVQIAELLIRS